MKSAGRLLPVVLLFTAVIPALSQDAPRTLTPDTIYVGADGTFDAEPDTAIVQFNISTQENKLKPAYDKAEKAAEQVREVLRSNGIDPKEATISGFRIAPVYDWKGGGKRKLIAYKVNSAVTIRLKDFSKVAAISDAFGNLDVTDEQSINYVVENTEAAKTKAVEDAMRRARSNAETAARVGGRELGKLVTAKIDITETPILVTPAQSFESLMELRSPTATRKEMVPPPPPPPAEFGAGKITIVAHVTALFGLK